MVSVLLLAVHARLGGAPARGPGQRGPLAGAGPPRARRRRRDARGARAARSPGSRRRRRRPEARSGWRGLAWSTPTAISTPASPPTASWSTGPASAGVTRIATVGTDPASIERALQAARAHPEVAAIVGRHPHETAGFDAARTRGDRASRRRARACGRSARPASTTTATTRRARTSAGPSPPSSTSRRGSSLPVVIHTRAAEEDTFALLREHADAAARRDPALLLGSRSDGRMRRARLSLLVCRQRHLPEGDRSAGGGPRAPGRAAAGRDRLPLPRSPAPARPPERAGQRRAHGAARGRPARRALRGARADVEDNAARVFGW